jgi:hypothetical protein
MAPYVYELIDPRDGKVFYVGKGRKGRINAHESDARKGKSGARFDRIREIEATGQTISKRIVSRFNTDWEAFLAEAKLIAAHGLENLTNVKTGGGRTSKVTQRADDAEWVSAVAEFMNRTKGGRIKSILIAGQKLDLAQIAVDYATRVAAIAQRRGADWVNTIAARWNVAFKFVEA